MKCLQKSQKAFIYRIENARRFASSGERFFFGTISGRFDFQKIRFLEDSISGKLDFQKIRFPEGGMEFDGLGAFGPLCDDR